MAAPLQQMGRSALTLVDPAENSRGTAKVVAIIDLILWTIGLLFHVFVLAASITLLLTTPDKKGRFREPEVALTGLAVMTVFYLIHAIVEFIIAYGLLKATDPNTPVPEAIAKAKRYRVYRLVFLILKIVLSVILTLLGGRIQVGGFGLLFFFLRVVSIFVVSRFIEDLERSQQQQRQEPQAPPPAQPTQPH